MGHCWSIGVSSIHHSTTPLLHQPILTTPLLLFYAAAFLRNVLLKLFAIFFYKGRRRHGRRIAEGTTRGQKTEPGSTRRAPCRWYRPSRSPPRNQEDCPLLGRIRSRDSLSRSRR